MVTWDTLTRDINWDRGDDRGNIIKTLEILGLGEANFKHDHDIEEVQQPGYTLHIDSSVDNPDLGMARDAVYTLNVFRVKRRHDLEDEK